MEPSLIQKDYNMQHLKNYVNKIEAIISAQLSQDKKPKSKGLLSSTKNMKTDDNDKVNDVEIIARFVYGIRKAKEEVINNGK
jgi:hypothetical protein